MGDGVTLDVPSFSSLYLSSLLFSLLLYFITSLLLGISAQYKWRQHGFLPHPVTSQVEVEFPRAPDPPKRCTEWY
jgi:hypothetical protein